MLIVHSLTCAVKKLVAITPLETKHTLYLSALSHLHEHVHVSAAYLPYKHHWFNQFLKTL